MLPSICLERTSVLADRPVGAIGRPEAIVAPSPTDLDAWEDLVSSWPEIPMQGKVWKGYGIRRRLDPTDELA
jgi:hypothetical protein